MSHAEANSGIKKTLFKNPDQGTVQEPTCTMEDVIPQQEEAVDSSIDAHANQPAIPSATATNEENLPPAMAPRGWVRPQAPGVKRFLRIPNRIAKLRNIPSTVECLPVGDIPKGEHTYGIKLKDAYQDTIAIVTNERYYVIKALQLANRAFVVEAAAGDPILIIDGILDTERNISTIKIEFIPLPTFPLPADQQIPQDKDEFVAVQLTSQSIPSDHWIRAYENEHFKTYRLIPVPGSGSQKKALTAWKSEHFANIAAAAILMPHKAITTSQYTPQMGTVFIHKTESADSIANKLTTVGVPYIHLNTKNSLRILVKEWNDDIKGKINSIPGVMYHTIDSEILSGSTTKHYAKTYHGNKVHIRTTTQNPLDLKIARSDGSPMSEDVGKHLAALINANFIKISEGKLWVRGSDAAQCEALNECSLGGIYHVSWPNAPEETFQGNATSE